MRRHEESIENYNKVIEIDSKNFEAYYHRANNLANIRKYHDALIDYDKSLSIKEDYIPAMMEKVKVLYKLKNYEKVIELCSKINLLEIGNEYSKVIKGEAFLALGKLKDAKKIFNEVLELNPNAKEAIGGIANIFTLQGNHDEANKLKVKYLGIIRFSQKAGLRVLDCYEKK